MTSGAEETAEGGRVLPSLTLTCVLGYLTEMEKVGLKELRTGVVEVSERMVSRAERELVGRVPSGMISAFFRLLGCQIPALRKYVVRGITQLGYHYLSKKCHGVESDQECSMRVLHSS